MSAPPSRRKTKNQNNYASGHADGLLIAKLKGANGSPSRVSIVFMQDEISPKPLAEQDDGDAFEPVSAVFASVIMDLNEAQSLRRMLTEAIEELSDDESD